MKSDMASVVKEVAKFLGKEYSDEEVDNLCNHLSIDSMRLNPSCSNDILVKKCMELNGKDFHEEKFRFIRKGEIGSYKSENFSPEILESFEKFIDDEKLKEYGFVYKM